MASVAPPAYWLKTILKFNYESTFVSARLVSFFEGNAGTKQLARARNLI